MEKYEELEEIRKFISNQFKEPRTIEQNKEMYKYMDYIADIEFRLNVLDSLRWINGLMEIAEDNAGVLSEREIENIYHWLKSEGRID